MESADINSDGSTAVNLTYGKKRIEKSDLRILWWLLAVARKPSEAITAFTSKSSPAS